MSPGLIDHDARAQTLRDLASCPGWGLKGVTCLIRCATLITGTGQHVEEDDGRFRLARDAGDAIGTHEIVGSQGWRVAKRHPACGDHDSSCKRRRDSRLPSST